MEPHKTAIHRSKPSLTVRKIELLKLIENPVFDYGCGTGKDAQYLESKGYLVNFWDPYFFNKIPLSGFKSQSYRTIFCTYILNVIPNNERNGVIKNIQRLLEKNGKAFFTVRTSSDISDKAEKNGWKKELDGWITHRGTFQKGFNPDELSELITKDGFKVRTISTNPVIIEAVMI